MLSGVIHLSLEMCHINHTQRANDHLAEAPAEGNCCPLGTVIWVDLQPQAHLASSVALMAVLLCHPPICSPQLKINSPLHCGKVEKAWQCFPGTGPPNGRQPAQWWGARIMRLQFKAGGRWVAEETHSIKITEKKNWRKPFTVYD